MKINHYKAFGLVVLALSAYFFSRFTVDDAFIGWRYAKNLIDFGIWNYNPSNFDLTNAYTSPLLTFLSIIPEILGINVVLFFKLFFLINAFIVYFVVSDRLKDNSLLLIIFFALPSTIIHIFSGLETFFFISFLFLLFVSMYKNNIFYTLTCSIVLVLTRPESYSLVFILPIYFLVDDKIFSSLSIKNLFIKKKIFLSLGVFFSISAVILSLVYFNNKYFGYPLTNTFYVKTDSFFRPSVLLLYSFFIIPLFYLLYIKKVKLFISISLFFLPMAFIYSISSLGMNYNMRFLFHIFAPIFLFILYLSKNVNSEFSIKNIKNNLSLKVTEKKLVHFFLVPFLCIFFYQSNFELRATFTYYPRLLDSLGAFGSKLNLIKKKYNLNSIAYGDAGLLPYNSNLNNLDLFYLGSSKLTFQGINNKLIDLYNPQLIFFHTRGENKNIRKSKNQVAMMNWAKNKSYVELCHLYVGLDYTIKVISKKKITELIKICEESKVKNLYNDHQYIKRTLFIPPWYYWK